MTTLIPTLDIDDYNGGDNYGNDSDDSQDLLEEDDNSLSSNGNSIQLRPASSANGMQGSGGTKDRRRKKLIKNDGKFLIS